MIVVNWNGKQFLDVCLLAMRRQTFRDFETILVDNGSSDGSVEYVRTAYPEVKLVSLPENGGFTGGNITGYELATGSLIVLLNNDTEAHPEWLEQIHEASRLFPKAGSFASKMMYFDARRRIENCGFSISPAGTTTDLGRDEPDGPEWTSCHEVFGACGGAVAYRRSMLEDVGFLDPDFFMIYEDVDLSFRAQLRGYRCVYVPTAIVYHRYRASLETVPARQVFYSQRNIEFVYFKNMPTGLMLRSLAQRIVYEIGAALYFLEKGSGKAFMSAKFEVIKHFPSIWRKRRQIHRKRTASDQELLGIMTSGLASKWRKLRSCWE